MFPGGIKRPSDMKLAKVYKRKPPEMFQMSHKPYLINIIARVWPNQLNQ